MDQTTEQRGIPLIERLGRGIAGNVRRWFPDPFLFALILLFVVCAVAWGVRGRAPGMLARDMYHGFWGFLSFAMQMCLILVTGSALARHRAVRKLLRALCAIPRTGKEAAALTAFVACALSWVNWGLGLIAGAYLAREMGRQARLRKLPVHYPVLCTAGYAGLGLIWHWGLSGSAPLLCTVEGNFLAGQIGVLPIDMTTLHPYALINSAIMLAFAVGACYMLHPAPDRCKGIEQYAPQLMKEDEEEEKEAPGTCFAERIGNSRIIAFVTAAIMAISVYFWFADKGLMRGLDLNAVNFCFILLGLLLYHSPVRYMKAISAAAASVGGIILLFPFYAAINGVMARSGLAAALAGWLARVATPFSFPAIALMIGGLLNLFIPSGGGEWLTIGETITSAGMELGVPPGKFIIAYCAGDAWTNLFNPFWAIPLLGITQIKARDMFGYCITLMILASVPYVIGLTFVPY